MKQKSQVSFQMRGLNLMWPARQPVSRDTVSSCNGQTLCLATCMESKEHRFHNSPRPTLSWAKGRASWNVMAHAQKPNFVFRRNGRVHLNLSGRQFSRLLTAEVCASAVVMLDTPAAGLIQFLGRVKVCSSQLCPERFYVPPSLLSSNTGNSALPSRQALFLPYLTIACWLIKRRNKLRQH